MPTGSQCGLVAWSACPFSAAAETEMNKRKSFHFHCGIHGGLPPALLANIAALYM